VNFAVLNMPNVLTFVFYNLLHLLISPFRNRMAIAMNVIEARLIGLIPPQKTKLVVVVMVGGIQAPRKSGQKRFRW
jgi:hypothetical protein